MSKIFWWQKIVQRFVITHYIYKLVPACKMSLSLIYGEKRTMQYRSLNCAAWAQQRVEKCVKFATANGLPENCPRKYMRTDRSPNRIRTFSGVQNFLTFLTKFFEVYKYFIVNTVKVTTTTVKWLRNRRIVLLTADLVRSMHNDCQQNV